MKNITLENFKNVPIMAYFGIKKGILKGYTRFRWMLLIERKHVYTYDMPFLCPPTVFKIFHLLYTERKIVIFFFISLGVRAKPYS